MLLLQGENSHYYIRLTVIIKIRTQPLTTQYVHHGDRSTSFFTVYTSEKKSYTQAFP